MPDPRTHVTPDAFSVAPELLGLPLATPWRRAAAMLVDLIVVAMLVNAGGLVLAGAIALVIWRATRTNKVGPFYLRWLRYSLRLGAAFAVFVALLVAEWPWERWGDDDDDNKTPAAVSGVATLERMGLGGVVSLGGELEALRASDSRAEALPIAQRLVASARDLGIDSVALDAIVADFDDDDGPLPPHAVLALQDALATADSTVAVPDTIGAAALAARYAAAAAADDSTALASLDDQLLGAIAGDTLHALGETVERLRSRNYELAEERDELEDERDELRDRSPGLLTVIRAAADDLGLGLGWAGLYFTAFLSLWKGRTPGKRLFGMRVVRLDGKPITLWAAFERFGGYSAGLFTGMLGYFEVFWDPNRQALHDKIAKTVVVRR